MRCTSASATAKRSRKRCQKKSPKAEDPHFFGCRWLSGDASAVVHLAGRARLILQRSVLQDADAQLGKEMRQAHDDQREGQEGMELAEQDQ